MNPLENTEFKFFLHIFIFLRHASVLYTIYLLFISTASIIFIMFSDNSDNRKPTRFELTTTLFLHAGAIS